MEQRKSRWSSITRATSAIPSPRKSMSDRIGEEIALPDQRHVVVGGMRLHYLDWAGKHQRAIVFLHGGGLTAHTWDIVCSAFRYDYHCYALDLRGHGDSEWSPVLDYGLAAHVRDLDGLLAYLGAQRPVLVGHSLGGHAAIRYASRHSDLVAGLVVIDTSPFFQGGPKLTRIRDFILGADQFELFEDAIEYVRVHHPSRDAAKLRHSLKHALRQLPDGQWTWKRDQRHLNDRYFTDALKELQSLLPVVSDIRCPTLLVRGESGALTAEDADKFRMCLPHGRAVTVEGAGHNVQTDNPAALVAVLRSFLAEVTRPIHELAAARKEERGPVRPCG